METRLSEAYKRSVVDAVQAKIDGVIERTLDLHEYMWLSSKGYPCRMKCFMPKAVPLSMPLDELKKLFGFFFLTQDIQYEKLYPMIRRGEFEKDVDYLFEWVWEKYLDSIWGG